MTIYYIKENQLHITAAPDKALPLLEFKPISEKDIDWAKIDELNIAPFWNDDIKKILLESLPKCINLRVLGMRRIRIPDKDAQALAVALQNCSKLENVDLTGNTIENDGIKALAQTLSKCPNLKLLYLNHNNIEAEGAKALKQVIESCPKLMILDIDNNKIEATIAQEIQKILQDHQQHADKKLPYIGIVLISIIAYSAITTPNTLCNTLLFHENLSISLMAASLAMILCNIYAIRNVYDNDKNNLKSHILGIIAPIAINACIFGISYATYPEIIAASINSGANIEVIISFSAFILSTVLNIAAQYIIERTS